MRYSLLSIMTLFTSLTLFAQSQAKSNIAIFLKGDLDPKDSTLFCGYIEHLFQDTEVARSKYGVTPRGVSDLEQVLDEMDLHYSDLFNPEKKIPMGKFEAADSVIVVDAVEKNKNEVSFRIILRDVRTGKSLKSALYPDKKYPYDVSLSKTDLTTKNLQLVAENLVYRLDMFELENSDVQKNLADNKRLWGQKQSAAPKKIKSVGALIPGYVQIQTGKKARGYAYIVGVPSLIAGGIAGGVYFSGKIGNTHKESEQQMYENIANGCYIAAGIGALLYVVNIFDGINLSKKYNEKYCITPYATPESAGVALTYRF